MERVIKFRFWRGDRMILWKEFEVIYDLYYFLKKKDVVAMQFTGLHDKNGVEIYEGDIIFGRYGKDTVMFIDGGFQPFCGDINVPFCEESEVIGNIYESPELLKPTNA